MFDLIEKLNEIFEIINSILIFDNETYEDSDFIFQNEDKNSVINNTSIINNQISNIENINNQNQIFENSLCETNINKEFNEEYFSEILNKINLEKILKESEIDNLPDILYSKNQYTQNFEWSNEFENSYLEQNIEDEKPAFNGNTFNDFDQSINDYYFAKNNFLTSNEYKTEFLNNTTEQNMHYYGANSKENSEFEEFIQKLQQAFSDAVVNRSVCESY